MSQLIVARCYEPTGPVITALLQKHSAFKEAAHLEQPHNPDPARGRQFHRWRSHRRW
jgi:hypothetical protein